MTATLSAVISQDSPDSDPMKYGVLGDDNSSAEEKLSKYTGTVPWSYLEPHYQSGCLYFVDPGIKLEVVGTAFSENDTGKVEQWLKSGDLVKIESLHAKHWQETTPDFEALVVSPFVLCRPI